MALWEGYLTSRTASWSVAIWPKPQAVNPKDSSRVPDITSVDTIVVVISANVPRSLRQT